MRIMSARRAHVSEPATTAPADGRRPTVIADGLHVAYKVHAPPARCPGGHAGCGRPGGGTA